MTVRHLNVYRCYEVALLDSLPPCVSACWELFCSEAFFLLLSNFTGLRLHYLSPSDEDSEDEEEAEDDAVEDKEDNEDENDEPLSLEWPETPRKQATYLFLLPIIFPLWLTVPDVRNPVRLVQ